MLNYTTTLPEGKWSGAHKGFPVPPAIGSRVNLLGTGTVIQYFAEAGWIGLVVAPDEGQRPDWHLRQLRGKPFIGYHVFGAEIAPIRPPLQLSGLIVSGDNCDLSGHPNPLY